MRILVVEDNEVLARGIARVLVEAGYAVDIVGDGTSAEAAVATERFDVIILDLNLPELDGLAVLKSIRASHVDSAVLILTARSAPGDKVKGLNLGADDYLTKPFDVDELEARVRALIRRSLGMRSASIVFGQLCFDLNTRTVSADGAIVEIPARELSVFETLIANAGRVVTKQALIESLSAFDADLSFNAIEQYISRLRKKIGPYGLTIVTARGIGYYLEKVDH